MIDRRSSTMPAEMSCSSYCVITHLPVDSTCPEMLAPTQDAELPRPPPDPPRPPMRINETPEPAAAESGVS